jgi:hypothetical protein
MWHYVPGSQLTRTRIAQLTRDSATKLAYNWPLSTLSAVAGRLGILLIF